jgi:hypothetical protein
VGGVGGVGGEVMEAGVESGRKRARDCSDGCEVGAAGEANARLPVCRSFRMLQFSRSLALTPPSMRMPRCATFGR